MRNTTWIHSPTSALMIGPRYPIQLGLGMAVVKLASVYSTYTAFLNLSDAIISLLAENWRVRGFFHGHAMEQVVVGGEVIPFNLLSCKQRGMRELVRKRKKKNKSN